VELQGSDGRGGGAQRLILRVNEPRKTGARSTAKNPQNPKIECTSTHVARNLRGKDGDG
jgi:hypothetical protein